MGPRVVSSRIVPPPPPGWRCWEDAMREAIGEAGKAGEAGETPVGAIVLSGHGDIIGRAGNAVESLCDPTAHAEILALRAASESVGNYRLEGCILVVTLEPCLMCAGALAHARVAGLVYGAEDRRAGAVQSQLDGLELSFHTHFPWHMGGICATECAGLLRSFFSSRR